MDAIIDSYNLPNDDSKHAYSVLDKGYSTQWGVHVPTMVREPSLHNHVHFILHCTDYNMLGATEKFTR